MKPVSEDEVNSMRDRFVLMKKLSLQKGFYVVRTLAVDDKEGEK